MPVSIETHKQVQTIIPGSSVIQLSGMNVRALAAVTSKDVWIAGQYTDASERLQAFYEHFDGVQWEVVDAHIPGSDSNITSLSARSANDIWAVGHYASGALIEHWDGNSWSLADKNISHNSDLASVLALSANDVWAVGEKFRVDALGSVTLIKHFDGNRWQEVDSPSLGAKSSLTSITAISSTELWAVGGSYYNGPITEHYIDGKWSLVSNPQVSSDQGNGAPFLISVAAHSKNDVWAVGNARGNQFGPLIEHWNNRRWSLFPGPRLNGTYQQLTSVLPLQGKNVWARGTYTDSSNNNRPLVTRWDGYEWDLIPLPDNLTQLNAWQQLGSSNVILGIGTYDKQVKLLTIPAIPN
ncbi:MAG: hypothetical protein H0U76_01455 [Ktedonobacteraceae bacterium]|nr:hypothetical protein [Ktedonobacteraceae bacterium]